jgi:hypothetical protein
MITIRHYTKADAPAIGRLIADTYSQFNLSFLPNEQVGLFFWVLFNMPIRMIRRISRRLKT